MNIRFKDVSLLPEKRLLLIKDYKYPALHLINLVSVKFTFWFDGKWRTREVRLFPECKFDLFHPLPKNQVSHCLEKLQTSHYLKQEIDKRIKQEMINYMVGFVSRTKIPSDTLVNFIEMEEIYNVSSNLKMPVRKDEIGY